MAASSTTLSISGGSCLKLGGLQSEKLDAFGGRRSQLVFRQFSKKDNPGRLSVRSEYSNGSSGGSGDFIAGFLLGGAICGTLAYVFAPQIRRSLLNEDESGFRRAKRPVYYDEGLETRQTLNAKISQLNSAIDNVSSRLRGGNNPVPEPVEADPEVGATM
ncbi:hypothetical protein DsansV1_C29g0211711 [Dioscorea sansibarensis]